MRLFFKMGHSRPFFIIFVFSIQLTVNVWYKFLPMTGFELQTSRIGSHRSTNLATTTAQTFLPLQMVLRLTAVALFKATLIRTLEIIWIRKSRWTFYFKYSPKKCLLICSWTCCKTFQITDNSNQQNSTLL